MARCNVCEKMRQQVEDSMTNHCDTCRERCQPSALAIDVDKLTKRVRALEAHVEALLRAQRTGSTGAA